MEAKTVGVIDLDIKGAKLTDATGEFEAVLSVPTLDRDDEVIDAKAFEPLPERITIDVDHGLSVDSTVGSGVPYYDGDVLKVKGSFSSIPRAQEVRTLVAEGHITKMSVAFFGPTAVREVDEKDGKVHLRRAELLNAAIVAIPSNREADILAAKAAFEKVGARNSAADQSIIQEVHDFSCKLGAKCAADDADTETSDTDPEGKAAAPAAADLPAEVTVARAHAFAAEALLLLTD